MRKDPAELTAARRQQHEPQRARWSRFHHRRPLVLVSAILLCVICVAPTTIALRRSQSNNIKVPKQLGIYRSETSRKAVTRLSWGVIQWGDGVSQTLYLQNRDREAVVLELVTANWAPLYAEDVFSVQWDLAPEAVLPAKAMIPVTISLVAPSASHNITDFHFDIVILVTPYQG